LERLSALKERDLRLAEHVVLKSRWADDLSQQLGDAEGRLWEARRIVLAEPKPKQLAALKRLFRLRHPKKRDLKELALNYVRLTEFKPARGRLRLPVRTGPRAPVEIRVERCPLEPEEALEELKKAYAAKTTDSILKDLHHFKRLIKPRGASFPDLPHRRR
jgi:hypothetical protein